MTADQTTDTPEEQLDPFKIEGARSSRSKCKTCRRPIEKDTLRLGILIEGPFGTGYLWHHLDCAAKRQWESLEEAYNGEFWVGGVKVPPLEEKRKLREEADKKKAEKKETPHVEVAPTGRSKCRHCDATIDKGDYRIALAREVEFYGQTRVGPINVHTGCVGAELMNEDCATEIDGFADAVRANSKGIDAADIDKALTAVGELPG